MTERSSNDLTRLKRVILGDSIKIPNGVLKVLQTDVSSVLSGYFNVVGGSLKTDVSVDENGVYDIAITAKATSTNPVKTL